MHSPHWYPLFAHGVATAQLRLGRYEESVEQFAIAIDGYQKTNRPVIAAMALVDQVLALDELERFEQSFAALGEAIAIFNEYDRPVRAAHAELRMAQTRLEAASDEEDLRSSLADYLALVDRFPEDQWRRRGVLREGLATIYYLLGEPELALLHAMEATRFFERGSLRLGVASVHGVLGAIKVRLGAAEEGVPLMEAGLKEMRNASWGPGVACNAAFFAEACRHLGRLECAKEVALESLETAKEANLSLAARRALEVLLWHATETGDVAEALAYSAELVDLTREVSRKSWSLQRGALTAQTALARKARALERAELEARLGQAERNQQRLAMLTVVGFAGVLLWIIVWLLRLWTQTRAAARSSERGRLLVETLNVELQHRFGNHLTVLRSLTARESRTVRSTADANAALARLRRSIDAIATLDQLMSNRGDEQTGVQLAEVLEGALTMVEEIHGHERDVDWRVEGDEVRVVESMGLLMTLITVEAAINAYKHAFPGRNDGVIVARVIVSELVLELRVEDNGDGLPEGSPRRQSGLKLIEDLAEQIEAEFALVKRTEGGTALSLRVPASEWRPVGAEEASAQ